MLKYKAIPTSNKTRLAIFKILTVIVSVILDIWRKSNSNLVTAEDKKKDTKTDRYYDTQDSKRSQKFVLRCGHHRKVIPKREPV